MFARLIAAGLAISVTSSALLAQAPLTQPWVAIAGAPGAGSAQRVDAGTA